MLAARTREYADYAALIEDYFASGWTDGLPIIPPTPAAVESFLAATGLPSGTVLGELPTRNVVVTAEAVAINAVMAGCRPEYMPTVVAAVRALLHEKANAGSTTGSLAGPVHLVIVNGPHRHTLDVNSGLGCFGPGWRANATIGRALRLVIRNVLRAIPGEADRAAFSHPSRYSFCFAEDEEATDWIPLHVERGLDRATNAVTVFGCWFQEPVFIDGRTPEEIADTLAGVIKRKGTFREPYAGDDTNLLMVISRSHQRTFTDAGWTKDDIRAYLWPRIKSPRSYIPTSNLGIEGNYVEGGPVNLAKPENILIVAAGGEAYPETWLFFPHVAQAITEAVTP